MSDIKEMIDGLHEISNFHDFQMAVQKILQGMWSGTPVDEPSPAPPPAVPAPAPNPAIIPGVKP